MKSKILRNLFPTFVSALTFSICVYSISGANTVSNVVKFGPTLTATVTANLAIQGYNIPSNFVGWSVENQDLIGGYYDGTTAAGISLANLTKLFGTNGIIRIGGITSDLVTAPVLTAGIANNYATFLGLLGSGWSTIYGLSACNNNATTATTQAGLMITALGVSKVVFQIGNEPPFEQCGLSQGQWTTAYNAYRTAMVAGNASTLFAAPDVTNNSTVQSFVNGVTAGLGGQTYVTTHLYPYGSGYVANADQLIQFVYNNDTVSTTNSYGFQANTAYAGGKLMMTEGNNEASCGILGVSDRLMAATYYLNLVIALSNDGWLAYQPHNAIMTCFGQAHNGYYNFVIQHANGNFAATPAFYGMYLYSLIEGGQTVATTQTGTGQHYVRAIATNAGVGGKAILLVTNNSQSFPLNIVPSQSTAFTTASVLALNGKACDDAAPLLGGDVIGESGSWSGGYFNIVNGGSFTLSPCGAALVKFQ